jgi:hypothetical protein
MHRRDAQERKRDVREGQLRQRNLSRCAGTALAQRDADRSDVSNDEDDKAEERPPIPDATRADGHEPEWVGCRY